MKEVSLKATVIAMASVFALSACGSPPKPPQPTGNWVPINHPVSQTAVSTSTR